MIVKTDKMQLKASDVKINDFWESWRVISVDLITDKNNVPVVKLIFITEAMASGREERLFSPDAILLISRNHITTLDLFEENLSKIRKQFEADDAKWGNEFLKRTRKGQEERIFKRLNEYYDEFQKNGTPIPWEKVIGEANIGMSRRDRPDLWPE